MTNENTGVVVNSTTLLTEESFNRLEGMLASSNEADHQVARQILNQLDIQANIMYIWKLSKRWHSRMVNLRTKASRKFRDDTNLFSISWMSSYRFAQWLEGKGWLTHERYQQLKGEILDLLKSKDDHQFYELHFTVKPKFKHLDPEQELQKLRP